MTRGGLLGEISSKIGGGKPAYIHRTYRGDIFPFESAYVRACVRAVDPDGNFMVSRTKLHRVGFTRWRAHFPSVVRGVEFVLASIFLELVKERQR